MESQPQNSEFRINLENFHPCLTGLHTAAVTLSSPVVITTSTPSSARVCRPVILANIWVKPTTNCYRNEKFIFEIYNPLCISEKKSSNVA